MRRILVGIGLAAAAVATASAPLSAQRSQQAALLTNGTAWATSRGPDTVTAFDGRTGRVLTTIRVGKAPMGLAVPRGTKKLYVGNESSNDVSVISLARREVVATIPVGSRPHHMHASKDGTRVYVAEFGTNKIGVIDTMTDSLIAEWATGPTTERTHAPAPTHDGRTLYAVNSGANNLVALDARTGAIEWSMPTGANPSELMVAHDGVTGYLSVRNEDEVHVLDLRGRRIVREVQVGDQPDTLQLSPDERFLVVALRSTPAEVDVIDLRSFAVSKVVLAARLAGHNWLSANGRYTFVSLEDPASVAVIDHRTQRVVATWPYPGGGSVHGMVYDDPRATGGPALSIRTGRIAVGGDRIARVRLACASDTAGHCRGLLTLRDGGGIIGRRPFALPAGASTSVPIMLTPRAVATLARKGALSARAVATARDLLANRKTVAQKVVLAAARRRP
jgi:YVTN family beta-propeller protein